MSIFWAGQDRSYLLIDHIDTEDEARRALFSDSTTAATSEGRVMTTSKHPHIKYYRDLANYIFTNTGDPLTADYQAASPQEKTDRFARSVENYING
jgi:hypothetical protein